MFRAHFMRRAGIPAFLALTAVAVSPAPSGAAMIEPIDDNPYEPYEPPGATVTGSLRVEGQPVLGRSVDIVADLKIKLYTSYYSVTSSTWSIVSRPAGSTSALNGTALRRSLVLDRVGQYRIRVVACPSGCSVGTKVAPASTYEIVVNAIAQAPADFTPRTPSFADRTTVPLAVSGEGTKCQGGGGAVDPQWVTTSYFGGPASYKLVEGHVTLSKVAGSDNLLNHHSQDWNLHVIPDAPFRNLLNVNANPNDMEVEWETNQVPEAMRPTNTDRVSMYGYHIIDCGHGDDEGNYRTEIHPPVLWAVHRPRAFQIPSDQVFDLNRDGNASETVGSNVHVGGVVTDVWVNAHSGEITDNDSSSGLHQPSTDGWTSGSKINGPSNIQRSYTFNIYLPKSPEMVAKAWGKTSAKPAPLYFSVKRHPNAPSDAPMGPMPTIVPVTEGDLTYLRVTLDLSSYTGKKLAQQIEAGWVYPSPDNFGLETWRLSVPKIRVSNSLDTIWGDWNFWLADNGSSQQWTKIFSCQGCITDDTDYYAGSSPWQNMSTGGILANVKLFPGQPLRLMSTGYEDDNFVDDGINRLNAQPPKIHGLSSSVSTSHYVAYYNVANLGAVTPTLTTAGKALFDDYLLTGSGILAPAPDTVAMYSLAPVVEEEEEGGLKMLGGLSLTTAQTSIAKADTTRVDAALTRLRTKIDARLLANPAARSRLVAALTELAPAFPTTAWNAKFSDLYLKP